MTLSTDPKKTRPLKKVKPRWLMRLERVWNTLIKMLISCWLYRQLAGIWEAVDDFLNEPPNAPDLDCLDF